MQSESRKSPYPSPNQAKVERIRMIGEGDVEVEVESFDTGLSIRFLEWMTGSNKATR